MFRSAWAEGSAMFTMVMSSTTINWARAMTTSPHQRRLSAIRPIVRPSAPVWERRRLLLRCFCRHGRFSRSGYPGYLGHPVRRVPAQQPQRTVAPETAPGLVDRVPHPPVRRADPVLPADRAPLGPALPDDHLARVRPEAAQHALHGGVRHPFLPYPLDHPVDAPQALRRVVEAQPRPLAHRRDRVRGPPHGLRRHVRPGLLEGSHTDCSGGGVPYVTRFPGTSPDRRRTDPPPPH